MSPIQQMLLGVGAVATKTYVDDIFSTQVYTGTGSAKTINNGIDLSGEGGMVWSKARNETYAHLLQDTVRGTSKVLFSNSTNAEATRSDLITSFNNNGYTAGADAFYGSLNHGSGSIHSGWSFRKAKGFFDVVKISLSSYSTNQRISHSLGCIPGLILLKNTNNTEDWRVYHRDLGRNKYITLNESYSANSSTNAWGTVDATSTDFGFNTTNLSAGMPSTYVAYVFAGGESTAATARSVVFDSSSDLISVGTDSSTTADLNFGTGDLTIEAWIKCGSSQVNYPRIINIGHAWSTDTHTIIWDHASFGNKIVYASNNHDSSANTVLLESSTKSFNGDGQWHHVAVTRSGNTFRLFVDGLLEATTTWTGTISSSNSWCAIGNADNGSSDSYFNGEISNLRVVKGTAVYTSSFRPPTEPLANITNTKLLCCNNSSVTGSTVTPITLTSSGSPTASTDSPFDDPAGFVFGDAGDQNVIKCGSYVGSGSTGLEVNLGWEPQFLMVKASSFANEHWHMFDNMRGIVSAGDDKWLYPNLGNNEPTAAERIDLTSTGFKIQTDRDELNKDGETFIWMALRRPDGYVGKPVELGTDVFAMDTGNSSSTIPNFDSGFPVDFQINRQPATSQSWYTGSRLTSKKYLLTDTNAAEGEAAVYTYDSNTGWCNHNYNSDYQSWMWKRHAGFDVVTYEGNGSARQISHSLSKAPEMILIKCRDNTFNWKVFHKGANGGTNPEQYYFRLNHSDAEATDSTMWNNTAPTSTAFTIGSAGGVNNNNNDFIALLFASVDGISKVGYFDGQNSTITITTGFQPRFMFVKRVDATGEWFTVDTTRGWGSGNDSYLRLDKNNSAGSYDLGAPTSTGFTLTTYVDFNQSGGKYIYYAHA